MVTLAPPNIMNAPFAMAKVPVDAIGAGLDGYARHYECSTIHDGFDAGFGTVGATAVTQP